MGIQLFVPHFEVDECLEEIRECLEKGWTGLGFKTVAFEDKWKEYSGLPHAHFLNSATAGLALAVRIFKMKYDWDESSEIITTPLTFVSTNHAILYAGLKPVFADIDEYLCLDPDSVEARITAQTKAVMYVGYGGNAGQYDRIVSLCKKHGLKLILDAAHMAGTTYKGEPVGQDADVVVFSFQAVKNLPTGDSGMICFADAENDATARKLSWLGINKDTYTRTSEKGTYKWKYDVEYVGYKDHGNSIMAAIGLVQLRYLDRDNEYRRQIASWYDEEFSGNPQVIPIPVAPECTSSRHIYALMVEKRDALMKYLNDHEVYPGVHYRDNTEYSMYSYAAGSCPKARACSEKVLSLPMHMSITRDDVLRIGRLINDFCNQ